MKKMFTLLFSLGLLTAAFAQEGGRHQRDYNSQSYGYHDYQGYGNTAPYSNQNEWSNDRRDEDRYDWRNHYEDRNDFRRRFNDGGYGDDGFGMERHRHLAKYWRRHRHELSFRFDGRY